MRDTLLWLGFAVESDRIEGIDDPKRADVHAEALEVFCCRKSIAIPDLQEFVGRVEPRAVLRDQPGLNVMVGRHLPPPGGAEIVIGLEQILYDINEALEHPFKIHQRYEFLHPFTDGNGRSGRALWLLQMLRAGYDGGLGFLHKWYYQSLEAAR